MQGNVYIPKIVQLYHPSGELYASYHRFAEAHPEGSWFQSDAFFRFISMWPEAKPILLVALREAALRDPGRRYSKTTDPGRRTEHPTTQQSQQAPEANSSPLGSLLAVIIQNPVPTMVNFFPLAGLYKRFTARTVVYGGPLLAEGTRLEREMTLKTLLGALQDATSKQSLFTQFRNFYDLTDCKPLFHERGYRYHDRLNLLVDTPDTDPVWTQMNSTRRRQARKSLANGAELIYDPSPAQIDQYYDILKTLYRKKVRKPLPSRTFFHGLNPKSAQYTVPGFQQQHNHLSPERRDLSLRSGRHPNPTTPIHQNTLASGQPRCCPFITILVQHNNRIIGGITCPFHPGRTMYEWYVCGLDHAYKSRDIHPSVLATWGALDYAARQGIQRFDFMGLGKPEEPYGVRDFKARFGGKWVNHGRFSRVNKRMGYAISELVYNLKRLMIR